MPRKSSPLAQRIEELGIEPPDLAAICRVSLGTVEKWIENGPDAEGEVLLRFLTDDADALRRVNHLRRTYQGDMRAEDWMAAEVDIPYGTADTGKVTGDVPS